MKDPHAPLDSDEKIERQKDMKLWYNRAFGVLRNIMKLSIKYNPPFKVPLQFEYYVRLQYKIFPEMMEEFNDPELYNYPQSEILQLEQDPDTFDIVSFKMELDRPWGSFKINLLYKKKDAQEGEEGFDLMEIPEDKVNGFLLESVEPEPISLER